MMNNAQTTVCLYSGFLISKWETRSALNLNKCVLLVSVQHNFGEGNNVFINIHGGKPDVHESSRNLLVSYF